MSAIIRAAETSAAGLVKKEVAATLRQAIVEGRLGPGQRVVEAKWATELGAAQASVREAINLLAAEGFLVKDAGRSARVVSYGREDVTHIYVVRGAIEGLAAHIACTQRADLGGMTTAHDRMHKAVSEGDMRALLQSDLEFHLALTQASGNPILAEIGSRLLLPLFAFIQIRVLNRGLGPEAWTRDLKYHDLILQMIREGNPVLASQTVQQCMLRFEESAHTVWESEVSANSDQAE